MDRHDWPGNRDTCLTRIAAFESEIEQRRRFGMREPERPLNLTQGERELIELCGKDAQQHDIYRDGRQLRFRSDPYRSNLNETSPTLTIYGSSEHQRQPNTPEPSPILPRDRL